MTIYKGPKNIRNPDINFNRGSVAFLLGPGRGIAGRTGGGGAMSEQDVARLQEQIKTLFSDVDELKADVKEIKQQLANRLPLWATMLISVLTGVIGWLLR